MAVPARIALIFCLALAFAGGVAGASALRGGPSTANARAAVDDLDCAPSGDGRFVCVSPTSEPQFPDEPSSEEIPVTSFDVCEAAFGADAERVVASRADVGIVCGVSQNLGGVNLDAYCAELGRGRAVLIGALARDWRCQETTTTVETAVVSVNGACRSTYGDAGARAARDDAGEWRCIRRDELDLGPADRAAMAQTSTRRYTPSAVCRARYDDSRVRALEEAGTWVCGWRTEVNLGAVDLDAYCAGEEKGRAIRSASGTAWECTWVDSEQRRFRVRYDTACRLQTGRVSDAKAIDRRDPNSWQCWIDGRPIGSLDIGAYCASLGPDGRPVLDSQRARGWRCAVTDRTLRSQRVRTNVACRDQFGRGAQSEERGDTLGCVRRGNEVLSLADVAGFCREQGGTPIADDRCEFLLGVEEAGDGGCRTQYARDRAKLESGRCVVRADVVLGPPDLAAACSARDGQAPTSTSRVLRCERTVTDTDRRVINVTDACQSQYDGPGRIAARIDNEADPTSWTCRRTIDLTTDVGSFCQVRFGADWRAERPTIGRWRCVR